MFKNLNSNRYFTTTILSHLDYFYYGAFVEHLRAISKRACQIVSSDHKADVAWKSSKQCAKSANFQFFLCLVG